MFLELDDVVDEGKDVRLQSRGSKVCPFLPFHPNSENSQRLQEFHLFAVFVTLKLLYSIALQQEMTKFAWMVLKIRR